MNNTIIKAVARFIIILILTIIGFGLASCEKTEPVVGILDYNYDEYIYNNTKAVLGIDIYEEEDDEAEEPFDDIETEPEPVDKPDEEPIEAASMSFPHNSIIGTEYIDHMIFEEVISEISPELSGISKAILNNYHKHGIKPSFQLAVFCLESGYGKSGLSTNKNNIGGLHAYPTSTLTAYENAYSYDTKSDCVNHFGEIMFNKYIDNGLTTVNEISTIYCPPNSAGWSSNVMNLMSRIDSAYETKSM